MAARPATHPGPARARRGRLPGRARVREALTGYAFILPNLALFGAFMFLPLAWTFVLSTQETSGFGPVENVGLENYRAMFEDPVFWRSLINTVGYAAITVPLSLAGGLGLALLLNRRCPGAASSARSTSSPRSSRPSPPASSASGCSRRTSAS